MVQASASVALPLAMMLQLQAGDVYYYEEERMFERYLPKFEVDEVDQVAKTFADHVAAMSKCPHYTFDNLSWRTNDTSIQALLKLRQAAAQPGSETESRVMHFERQRMKWLSMKEEAAARWSNHRIPQLKFNDQGGHDAFLKLQSFCSHMAKSPANILVEIRG